jgi:PAS domain S-box-containing protein
MSSDVQLPTGDALRDERALLLALLESLDDAVIACDADGRPNFINNATRQLRGADQPSLPQEEWLQHFSLCRPDGHTPLPSDELPLFRALRGERIRGVELLLIAAGQKRIVSVSGQPLEGAGCGILGAVMVVHDITEQRRREKQLVGTQKLDAVGKLAGGVAHDLNNMLTIINGYSEILSEGLHGSDLGKMAEQVKKAGDRVAALTQGLLAVGRKLMLAPRALDLNALLAELEPALRRKLGESVSLSTSLAADLGQVRVDSARFQQALLDLAANARDAMPKGGTLTIATRNVELDEARAAAAEVRPGPYVALTMGDTGRGMTEEVRARLFEPFFTTKEFGKGTGLGLAAVHGFVKQSGGHIEVESAPGAGTTVHVYLPRVELP